MMLLFLTTQGVLDGRNSLLTMLPQDRRLGLFIQTLLFAVFVAAGGTLAALAAATMFHFSNSKHLRRLILLLIPAAVIPPHIHAMVWNLLLRSVNAALRSAGMSRIVDSGFFISWWVQMLALLPFALGILLLAMAAIPSPLLEAARITASGGRIYLRVFLPLTSPGLTAAFAFLFLSSLLDYSVPSLFQLNLYALGIFSEYSLRYDAAHAFLLSVPVLALSLPAVWMLQHGLHRIATIPDSRPRSLREPVIHQSLPLRLFGLFGIGLYLIQLLIPLLVLISQTRASFRSWDWLVTSLPDLRGTALVSLGTALLTFPLAHFAALSMHRKLPGHRLWWWLTFLPLALPAPLISIGLIHTWNSGPMSWTGLYSTLLMPVLACLLRFFPFSVLLLLARFRQIDPALAESTRLLQKNSLHGFLGVHLPLHNASGLGAALLAAVLAAGELGATLLLVPPGAGTLTLKIYNYLHYGQSEAVSGLCLLLYGISLLVGLLLLRILSGKRGIA